MEWNDLAYLLEVARSGSMSGAAHELDVAVSTVTRRLDALERQLGLRLLDRRPSGVRLTAHGERIVDLAKAVRTEVAAIERAAVTLRQGDWPDPIRVTATEMVIADVLAPALPALWAEHPGLRVNLDSRGEIVSLANREADVAVRMSPPQGDSLVVRRLPTIRLGLYASDVYLANAGASPLDYRKLRFLLYDQTYGRTPEVAWMAAAGIEASVFLRTGSTRGLLRAAVAGAGVALLPEVFARRQPSLVEVPTPRPIPARTPWLVVHRDLRRAKPVRAVLEWIAATFDDLLRSRPKTVGERRRSR